MSSSDSPENTGHSQSSQREPHRLSPATHRWNFWTCASEAALFITAVKIVGPVTLIPFLFNQVGIDLAWIGLFQVGVLIMALGHPIGTMLAGGRSRKLPFCLWVGFLQRLPFLVVPLGAAFLFDKPGHLIVALVTAWCISQLLGGIAHPIFQVVITSGVQESWWARMLSLRNVLGALLGILASGFVWLVNALCIAPLNYIILGWAGVLLLGLSLLVVSRIREVPMSVERAYGWAGLHQTLGDIRRVLVDDHRVRWIITGRVLRSSGVLFGTYLTPAFIARCHLTDQDMWLPVTLITMSEIICHLFAGWFIDRVGVKPALVISALAVAFCSAIIIRAETISVFVLLAILAPIGGAFLQSAWQTLLLKLTTVEMRPAYTTAITLGTTPGTLAILLVGIALVRFTGFNYVFYVSGLGTLAAAAVFYLRMPHILQAPDASPPEES